MTNGWDDWHKAIDAYEGMEKAMGPDWTRKGIFVNHNCSYCRNGELPCKQGAPNRCDNPRARND